MAHPDPDKLTAAYDDFSKACEAAGYTDTGELWSYADELRNALGALRDDAAELYAAAVPFSVEGAGHVVEEHDRLCAALTLFEG
jgi:hypothetical protein